MEDVLNRSDAFKEPKQGQLKIINRLTVGETSSDPRPVSYGKGIMARSSTANVEVSVFNSAGMFVTKQIAGPKQEITFFAPEISAINPPMIRFRSSAGEAKIEYELF